MTLGRLAAGAAALALFTLVLSVLPVVPARATAVPGANGVTDHWGRPFQLAPPMSLDLMPASLAFAPSGAAAVGFGAQNEDNPANSEAFTVVRSAAGRIGRMAPVAGAQQILDLAYDGKTLKLLTATGASGQTCCTTAQVVSIDARGRRSVRTVTSALSGATIGQLLVLPRHVTVAVLAAENGIWVERAPERGGNVPGPAHQLVSTVPGTLAATALTGGRSLAAWTASTGPAAPAPGSIMVARGSSTTAPHTPAAALRVPGGHGIDEVHVTGGSAYGTAAFVESWFDRAEVFHSEVAAADLRSPVRAKPFPISGRFASGVSLASNDRGDQMLAWQACDPAGGCRVQAVSRSAGGKFGRVSALGAVDAGEPPVAAVAPEGEAVVGWISNGHVFADEQPRPGARFAGVHRVSSTNYASSLNLGFAPNGSALAAWNQGTLNSSVVGAILH